LKGRNVFVSASAGIGFGSCAGDDLLRNADLAMYHAKARGRGHWSIFDEAMHVAAAESLQLEADLQSAIEQRELVLHFQPIVGLPGRSIVGFEALVRWQHPRLGLLPPSAFIPLAEQTGLILPVGRWVLEEACRAAGRWHARGADAWVSVNLSGVQLSQPDLVGVVADVLADSRGLPADKLTLELTETAMAADVPDTVAKLDELRSLGVRLAVDDFGTGYSSLQYLRLFPLEVLKVPKSFVDDLASPGSGHALAAAIVELGKSLDLEVIAEGIEHAAQAERLAGLGCHLGQGYLFSRPVPEAAIEALLPSRRLVA
jgi:EAL domain-containing protein (putative c-di-GMP-specific phosphodiesterase class I)